MKIGKVAFTSLAKNNGIEAEYSDGPVEDELLELVKSPDYPRLRNEVLANNPSWPMYYHLSPLRGNLVNWYPFLPNTKILEVGAGCGAITEAILNTVDGSTHVTALELSERRAKVNAYRNSSYSNLEVKVGNLEVLDNQEQYDYVVCVGVLEYSGRFISGDKPFATFLSSLYDLLKPGGTLLLAIENKFGLKYINGAREDHTGAFFDSLMSYPQYSGIRTFSKNELSTLATQCGFNSIDYHFPVPDYKLPRLVINESILQKPFVYPLLAKLYPAPAPDQSRVYIGSEQLILKSVIDAGLFAETANSFLIEAHKEV